MNVQPRVRHRPAYSMKNMGQCQAHVKHHKIASTRSNSFELEWSYSALAPRETTPSSIEEQFSIDGELYPLKGQCNSARRLNIPEGEKKRKKVYLTLFGFWKGIIRLPIFSLLSAICLPLSLGGGLR